MVAPTNKTSDFRVINTQLEHSQAIYDTQRLAYGITLSEACDTCLQPDAIAAQLKRFPVGQFVALVNNDDKEHVVGLASTMRLKRPPTAPPLAWLTQIGTTSIPNHQPDGEWLYGVEMAVHPAYRRRGIGTALYQARFELVKKLGLRGWYAGGMLMGYHRYADEMTVREYGTKVINREIIDPTVTMQMNRGFEGWQVIENYVEEDNAGNGAILIVWHNPEYKEK